MQPKTKAPKRKRDATPLEIITQEIEETGTVSDSTIQREYLLKTCRSQATIDTVVGRVGERRFWTLASPVVPCQLQWRHLLRRRLVGQCHLNKLVLPEISEIILTYAVPPVIYNVGVCTVGSMYFAVYYALVYHIENSENGSTWLFKTNAPLDADEKQYAWFGGKPVQLSRLSDTEYEYFSGPGNYNGAELDLFSYSERDYVSIYPQLK